MAKFNLVPIRVKIRHGVKQGRAQHIYPDFNQISAQKRGNMDWCYFIDAHGTGWHYDRLSGIGEVDSINPDPDVWYGCICVPEDFANEAASLFPNDVEIIDEDTFEDFYDNRHAVFFPEEIVDEDAVKQVEQMRTLGVSDSDSRIAKALDPNDPTPGIRKNPRRRWKDFKQKSGITIKSSLRSKIGKL